MISPRVLTTPMPLQMLLCLAGTIALGVGLSILWSPTAFYALNHIDLSGSVSLCNEVRASAGMLTASGLVMFLGVLLPRFTLTSGVLATLVFLSYGVSRLGAMAADGLPTASLVWSAAIELAVGLGCLWALQHYLRATAAADRSWE